MKRYLALLIFLLPAVCHAQFAGGTYIDPLESEVAMAMKSHVSFLSSAALEGRGAGTEGEAEAAAYLSAELESYGIDVLSGKEGELFGVRQASGDTLRSRNVVAYIPGYDKSLKDHYIVIGARLDNLGIRTLTINGEKVQRCCYGANGNASGLAMLLELAKKLSTNSVLLKRSVIIAAFGSSLKDHCGSWYFMNRSFAGAANVDAMINLDMVGTGSRGFYAYTASNADLNRVIVALSNTLQPVQPKIVAKEPCSSDHRMFYSYNVPVTFFTTGMYHEYNSERDTESIIEYEWMERELEYVYNYTVELANGSKPEFNPNEDARKSYVDDSRVVPYHECDIKPMFLGSTDLQIFMSKWVYVYLKYPKEAVRNGIQGRVLVDFIIDEKGKVRDVKVIKSSHPLLDDAAVKVIEASPDWRPARVRGQKVKSELSVNVEFRLEKK